MKSQIYEVRLSRADYAVGVSAILGELARLDSTRGRMLFGRLAVSILTLIIIGFAFPYSLPGLVTAGLLIWIGDLLVQGAFKTQRVGASFDPVAHAEMRVEFSDDAIVEQSELRTRRWTWGAVRRLHLSSGHLIVELKGWDMIVLPDRLWPTSEERSAFVAELEARRLSGETRMTIPSAGEAEARVVLTEPVLVARICLAVAAFYLVFEGQLPFDGGADRSVAFVGLGVALLGAAIMWWASGKAYGWLTERSASAALRTAWGVYLLMAAAFILWLFRLI